MRELQRIAAVASASKPLGRAFDLGLAFGSAEEVGAHMAEQKLLAQYGCAYLLRLLGRRLIGGLVLGFGFPGNLALLASPHVAEVEECLCRLALWFDALEALER